MSSVDEVVQAGLYVLEHLVDGQGAAPRWGEAERIGLLERVQEALLARLQSGQWPGGQAEAEEPPGMDEIEREAWLGE